VHRAIAAEVSEIGCWSLAPDERLGRRLTQLGFQDGWQPHWMGVDPRDAVAEYDGNVSESDECSDDVPYASPEHRAAIGGDVHHFVARPARGEQIVGHAVLNVDGTTGGIYDMGVVAGDRRQGHGLALTTAAVVRARELGCTSVTLNATGEGEPMYRRAGFRSLGLGMTWWMLHR
jgi:ribosomal protein S18 acetylase RimI-like enzyme